MSHSHTCISSHIGSITHWSHNLSTNLSPHGNCNDFLSQISKRLDVKKISQFKCDNKLSLPQHSCHRNNIN